MKERHAIAHMKAAHIYAELSYCNRRKVGCVIVKNDRIISIGYNGTPSGWDNCCEDEHGLTFPYVLHAEYNAMKKLEHCPEELEGSSIFVSYGPCINCVSYAMEAKVKEFYYGVMPTREEEIQFLEQSGIQSYFLPLL